ncbi:hypothetical protein PQR46_35605 [Paraburkholderia sediminicola]|uniref:hypothetical protein n=1 Tax=Paraburkholderia sediminicola TaxID=458836 RepID=UPI0038B8BD20
MFSLFNQPARSTANGAGQVCASEKATQSATLDAGDERKAADQPATYEEMFPYLMLAMVTAI